MYILNVFPQISTIIPSLSTKSTSVSAQATLRRLLNIVVKLLVP